MWCGWFSDLRITKKKEILYVSKLSSDTLLNLKFTFIKNVKFAIFMESIENILKIVSKNWQSNFKYIAT